MEDVKKNVDELNVTDEELYKVIQSMEEGKYRIPEFQREFVWEQSDVKDLFDSIYNEYPIGTLFFWRVPEDKWNYFRDIEELQQPPIEEVKQGPFPEINFVLDGQQRLSSIYSTVMGMEYSGTDFSRIVFDLRDEEFRIEDGKATHLVPVKDIWNDNKEVRDELDDKWEKRFETCRERLRSYPIPLVIVQSQQVRSVIDIFERINQEGTRLSRFDIVNANIWTEEFNLRTRIDEDLFKKLEEMGFGKIERGSVTQALALIIEGTCTTSAQKNLDPVKVQEVWDGTKESIIGAIDYLRNQNGVERADFIPYEGIIPVLAYYNYQTKGSSIDSDHSEYIDEWFWRLSIARRYSSSAQTRMTEDRKKMDKLIKEGEVEFPYALKISKDELIDTNIKRSKSGLRNAFLCLLAKQGPRHFEHGGQIDLTQRQYRDFRLNKHHIFPNAFLRPDYSKKMRKSIMDITFIPEDLNKEISDTNPRDYFSKIRDKENFEQVMNSHMIPHGEDSAIWDNEYEKFLEQRAEIVYSKFMDLMGEPSGITQDPTADKKKIVEKVESEIRDFICERLEDEDSNFWGQVPNDVNSNAQRRIQEKKSQEPDFQIKSDRQKLDFCDVMDYAKIINARWDKFEDVFPSKQEVERRFNAFNKYRNDVAHHKDMDRFTEMDGNVAIQWIRSCIKQE